MMDIDHFKQNIAILLKTALAAVVHLIVGSLIAKDRIFDIVEKSSLFFK